MTVKINLTINEDTAKRAKIFAEKNNISISKLVDDYLSQLTTNESKSDKKFAEKFGGILSSSIANVKEEKSNYLKKKYGK